MSTAKDRVERLRSCLEQNFAPTQLNIIDDTESHAGHDREAQGAGHFFITIASEQFNGLLPVARHRLVYSAVAGLMVTDIHALSIKAMTPQEAAAV